ncbi:MAG: T9SS type A sorting domain-containing protein, partial [Saprospiraceae bacterium]|nr:T9SS type A sorting domain-containing protein [Saprospiraceae bacterium]
LGRHFGSYILDDKGRLFEYFNFDISNGKIINDKIIMGKYSGVYEADSNLIVTKNKNFTYSVLNSINQKTEKMIGFSSDTLYIADISSLTILSKYPTSKNFNPFQAFINNNNVFIFHSEYKRDGNYLVINTFDLKLNLIKKDTLNLGFNNNFFKQALLIDNNFVFITYNYAFPGIFIVPFDKLSEIRLPKLELLEVSGKIDSLRDSFFGVCNVYNLKTNYTLKLRNNGVEPISSFYLVTNNISAYGINYAKDLNIKHIKIQLKEAILPGETIQYSGSQVNFLYRNNVLDVKGSIDSICYSIPAANEMNNSNEFYSKCLKYTLNTSTINEDDKFTILPNPVKGNLINVTYSRMRDEKVFCNLFSMEGKIIYNEESTFKDNFLTIDLPNDINTGIYYLKIYNKNNAITQKLIIE